MLQHELAILLASFDSWKIESTSNRISLMKWWWHEKKEEEEGVGRKCDEILRGKFINYIMMFFGKKSIYIQGMLFENITRKSCVFFLSFLIRNDDLFLGEGRKLNINRRLFKGIEEMLLIFLKRFYYINYSFKILLQFNCTSLFFYCLFLIYFLRKKKKRFLCKKRKIFFQIIHFKASLLKDLSSTLTNHHLMQQ